MRQPHYFLLNEQPSALNKHFQSRDLLRIKVQSCFPDLLRDGQLQILFSALRRNFDHFAHLFQAGAQFAQSGRVLAGGSEEPEHAFDQGIGRKCDLTAEVFFVAVESGPRNLELSRRRSATDACECCVDFVNLRVMTDRATTSHNTHYAWFPRSVKRTQLP